LTHSGEDWRANWLELNASDECGIDVVREKIKSFAKTRALSGSFKIIVLDEADALTGAKPRVWIRLGSIQWRAYTAC
jgi:DNA polymerase III delta prime subunit